MAKASTQRKVKRAVKSSLPKGSSEELKLAVGENRALLFHGLIFHQSAEAKFKPGFENRRRNVTMLFRKTRG